MRRFDLKVYLPFLFAIVLALGVLLGLALNMNKGAQSGQKKFLTIGFDRYDKLNDVMNYILDSYVDSINRQQLTEEAIVNLLRELDPHSSYIAASEFRDMNDPLMGSFDGIGIEFNMIMDTVVVISPIPGGPSDKAGLMPGDRIIQVEGELIAGINASTTDIVRKLKGPKGTKVTVSIYRKGVQELLEFTLTRDKIPSYSLDIAYMLDEEIGYIKLGKFSATSHQEFRSAMERLKREGMEKMVLDLRGNGGGFLEAAIQLADELLEPEKLIVYTDGRKRPRNFAFARRNGGFQDQPLVVLIDEWSASASEIIAGAVQDNDRGWVVGRRSFGKGLVQEQIQLNDGSAIRLTVARYYTPSGRSIQKPYDNGSEEYYAEFMQRILDGELEHEDSIKQNEELRFYTTAGRVVYGGGGITPDVFVPLETAERSPYFIQMVNRGLLYRFAFDYTDRNRQALLKYQDASGFISGFEVSDRVLNELVAFASRNDLKPDAAGLQTSHNLIKSYLKAYIGRNVFGNEAFYPALNRHDAALNKAIRLLREETLESFIPKAEHTVKR